LIDHPDDLVAWDQGKFGLAQLAINNVQIGPANGARTHLNPDLSGLWLR
jgi:hypothetical protein